MVDANGLTKPKRTEVAKIVAIRLIEDWGFRAAGETDQRVALTPSGREIILPPRKRWVHPNGFRATIGRDITYIYRHDGERDIPFAILKTMAIEEIRRALRNAVG